MWYAASIDLHACQDPDCAYATGVNLDQVSMDDLRQLAMEATRDALAAPIVWSVFETDWDATDQAAKTVYKHVGDFPDGTPRD